MFRKPVDDDDHYGSRVVKAKPLPEKYAQKLSMSSKDFVSRGCEGGGSTSSLRAACSSSSTVPPLTEDERNKIHAKILKAEMKGDTETAKRLKRKLEGQVENNESSVILLKRDRSGNVIPAQSSSLSSKNLVKSSSGIRREYEKYQSVEEMKREEKSSTAEDQLMLFHRSIIKSAKVKRHDDESLDDIAEMQKEKRGYEEKDRRRNINQMRKNHQLLEHSLNDCVRCLTSAKIEKHAVVAVGIHVR